MGEISANDMTNKDLISKYTIYITQQQQQNPKEGQKV